MKLNKTLTSLCKSKGMALVELSRRTGIPKQTLHNWTIGFLRQGATFNELSRTHEVMYLDFSSKAEMPNLGDLIKFQTANTTVQNEKISAVYEGIICGCIL